MKRFNNKGFTLIELLVTIVILALVLGISGYSIIQIVQNAKDNDYNLLIKNIKSGVELYYQECRYNASSSITCPSDLDGYYETTLGTLVEYGFLTGNKTIMVDSDGDGVEEEKFSLVNPKTNDNIYECKIEYKYNLNDGNLIVVNNDTDSKCPTTDSYDNN